MILGVTPGSGIGPELLMKVLENARLSLEKRGVLVEHFQTSLEAIEAALSGKIQGLLTGPIHKAELLDVQGRTYAGQTELLHHFLAADSKPPLMCFIGGPFVMGLATGHLSVKEVPEALTDLLLYQKIERLIDATAFYRSIPAKEVKIIVLGLNPHAGENGLIGDEEIQVFKPVIQHFQKSGFQVQGPVPADGFWYYASREGFQNIDAVLAMMHDQGLGPYKLLSKGRAANWTFGLKIPRLAPAHGTADDLVGTNQADATSMQCALKELIFLMESTSRKVLHNNSFVGTVNTHAM